MTFQWSKRAPYLKYKKQNRIHQNEGKNKIESGKAATLRTLPNITSNDPIVFQIVTIVDLSNQPPTIPDLVSAASAYRPIFRRPHATGGLGSAQEVRLRHGRMDLQRCRVPIIETMSTRETTATMSPWWHQRLQGRWLQSMAAAVAVAAWAVGEDSASRPLEPVVPMGVIGLIPRWANTCGGLFFFSAVF
jgi:hypothetical protein